MTVTSAECGGGTKVLNLEKHIHETQMPQTWLAEVRDFPHVLSTRGMSLFVSFGLKELP